MSKFKPGDRVRHTRDHSDTATILAVHEGLYWIMGDEHGWPFTVAVADFDCDYELIPEPFLPDGEDRYHSVYTDGHAGVGHPTLAEAESVHRTTKVGIIRIDGQTGELSWAKGGPQ